MNPEQYPRPDWRRDPWLDLNGEWEFDFDDQNTGVAERWYEPGRELSRRIQVPFCYQCAAGGIRDTGYHPVVWYRRKVRWPSKGQRVMLRFGAVDEKAQVYLNGQLIGLHEGGYLPFSIDTTSFWNEGENDLCVRVEDLLDRAQPRGKQYWANGVMGCWYTPVTGIWQSVYAERVGAVEIIQLHIRPVLAEARADIDCALDAEPGLGATLTLRWSREGKAPRILTAVVTGRRLRLSLDMAEDDDCGKVVCWSPETPVLYDVEAELTQGNECLDRLCTYFGMREITVCNQNVYLNGQRLYQRLVLDQGYWPNTLLTPLDDDALRRDVEWTKRLGFNGARKHQKVEDPRYYYWADRLGLLVWGELPSTYDFTWDSVRRLSATLQGFINRDFNHPCLVAWVTLNESWGVSQIVSHPRQQAFARMLYEQALTLDGTRLVSGNDGWEQVRTDLCALHDYAGGGDSIRAHFPSREAVEHNGCDSRLCYARGSVPEGNEAFMVTEYGGIAFEDDGETVCGIPAWGYNGKVPNPERFLARYQETTGAIRAMPYCQGDCYTQLTDVMQETNGLLTEDRQPKIDPERFAALNVNTLAHH
ncbi:MAG: glycoside hydrolase family 2 [Eubacteriales bacterium]|nr:glycoside hydrolase family 2 [Eubacteriales bacterium]